MFKMAKIFKYDFCQRWLLTVTMYYVLLGVSEASAHIVL